MPVKINGIPNHADPVAPNPAFLAQPFPAEFVHCDVAKKPRVTRRSIMPPVPAMADENGRRIRELLQRLDRFQVMMPMNHIWSEGPILQALNHGYSGGQRRRSSHRVHQRRPNHGPVAEPREAASQVHGNDLRARAVRNSNVSEENSQTALAVFYRSMIDAFTIAFSACEHHFRRLRRRATHQPGCYNPC